MVLILFALFLLPIIFTLVAASISHILTTAINLFVFSANWSPLLFISFSSSFSVIHVDVGVKSQSKERLSFVVVFFS